MTMLLYLFLVAVSAFIALRGHQRAGSLNVGEFEYGLFTGIKTALLGLAVGLVRIVVGGSLLSALGATVLCGVVGFGVFMLLRATKR